MSRTLCWFSAGAASAVATKIAVAETGGTDLVIAYTDPGSEHPDNERFLTECEDWMGHPIVRLKSDQYEDTWDVWEKTKYLGGIVGERCTVELKKKLRFAFQRPDDRQVFGYTAEETHRANRFRANNIEVDLWTPLIERGLSKNDCLALVDRAGIELPTMYKLGYRNNNCIGCPKGGMGYWNKIRRDFPEVFARMANLERQIGKTVFTKDGQRMSLDDLDPNAGNHADEPSFECSLLCALAESDFEDKA